MCKIAHTEQAAALLARLSFLHCIVAHLQLLLESGESHCSFLKRIAQPSEVSFLGRIALEPVARPALLAAHTLVLVHAAERQLEVAEPLDEDLTRSLRHSG